MNHIPYYYFNSKPLKYTYLKWIHDENDKGQTLQLVETGPEKESPVCLKHKCNSNQLI